MPRPHPYRELTTFTAPDGTVYPFHVPSNLGRWVLSQPDWGTPVIDYLTDSGPAQSGATVRDFFLRPRTVQLLIRQNFCDREDYWSGRAALLNAIRPNRQLTPTGVLPGRLTRYLPNGDKRALDVYISDGPRFEGAEIGQWQEHSFQEVLRFTAYNPVVYDPTAQSTAFIPDAQLVFPITFPITFGSLAATTNVTYPGTWQEYPVFVVTGPVTGLIITNLTTGESITLNYAVPAGVSVTIDLSYGAKTVIDSLGNNLIGSVSPASDLGTWHLAPDPEAPGGVNQIEVTGTGVSGASSVVMSWYSRYFGI